MPVRISKNRVALENIPLNEAIGQSIASASTINLTTATGNTVHITGTTAITAVTLGAGMVRDVIFDGILTLTHHATNNHLPGGANITTAANDRARYIGDGTTVYCVNYQKADGKAVVVATPVFSSSFESSEIAISVPPTGTYNVAHGLGSVPKLFQVVLRCKISEYSFGVGDEIRIDSSGASTEYAGSASVTPTYITFKALGTIQVNRLDTHAIGAITPGNWKLVMRAWN